MIDKGIIAHTLSQRLLDFGFTLREDDHCIHLYLKDERRATFNASRATFEAIQEEADRQLEAELHLIDFEPAAVYRQAAIVKQAILEEMNK